MRLVLALVLLLFCSVGLAQNPVNGINIYSKKLFEGPDGIRLSCFELACFEFRNSQVWSNRVHSGQAGPPPVDVHSEAFGKSFAEWTPAIVEFLKQSVERCVSEKQSEIFRAISLTPEKAEVDYCRMWPYNAERLIDDVYNTVTTTKEQERIRAEQLATAELNRRATEERQAAIIREDKTRGYTHKSFTDFELDSKSMKLGIKLAITGFYQMAGAVEVLVDRPALNGFKVYLITEAAPRESRRRFIECRKGLCLFTVLGHLSKCSVTWLGHPVSSPVCLVVDDTRSSF